MEDILKTMEVHEVYSLIKQELFEIENIAWEMRICGDAEKFLKMSDEKFNKKWALAEKIQSYIEARA